jgi:hypothetical protein
MYNPPVQSGQYHDRLHCLCRRHFGELSASLGGMLNAVHSCFAQDGIENSKEFK